MVDDDFDYMNLAVEELQDLWLSAYQDNLFGIISEQDGGIVAYAIGRDHADAIVRALRAAKDEYKAEMEAIPRDRRYE
jgi:hypothetical protein